MRICPLLRGYFSTYSHTVLEGKGDIRIISSERITGGEHVGGV